MNDGLHLNDTHYDRQTLIRLARQKEADTQAPGWEHAFWTFLSAWLNDQPDVAVRTSGSTGTPKTLRIRKDLFLNSAQMTLDFLQVRSGDSALLCLSANYIAGKMMIVRALSGGLRLAVVSPQVDGILSHEGDIDFSAMVPLQVRTLMNRPDGRSRIERIGKLLIGGAPISPDLEKQLAPLGNQIYATYGMTETVSHIALRRLNGPERSQYYRIFPGVSIATDENGCLIINAPSLADNPIRTTDIVRMVSQTEFEMIGRYDHVINSGGIKHSPEAIEQKLADIISDRFIISSLPDEKLGEKLILIIESTDRNKYDWNRLKTVLKERLAPYECPKMAFFLEKFPTVGNEKLSRLEISRKALED